LLSTCATTSSKASAAGIDALFKFTSASAYTSAAFVLVHTLHLFFSGPHVIKMDTSKPREQQCDFETSFGDDELTSEYRESEGRLVGTRPARRQQVHK
jgi:hypothetical protein